MVLFLYGTHYISTDSVNI